MVAAALIVGRLLQALGACAGIVLARAIIRDVYDREAAARGLALVMMAMTWRRRSRRLRRLSRRMVRLARDFRAARRARRARVLPRHSCGCRDQPAPGAARPRRHGALLRALAALAGLWRLCAVQRLHQRVMVHLYRQRALSVT
jgi:hypothetical protein